MLRFEIETFFLIACGYECGFGLIFNKSLVHCCELTVKHFYLAVYIIWCYLLYKQKSPKYLEYDIQFLLNVQKIDTHL